MCCDISPAISLICPGAYHALNGKVGDGIGWFFITMLLMPTVVLWLIPYLLCYSSAVRLSKIQPHS